MPRKSAIDVETLLSVLKGKPQLFDGTTKLRPRSDEVWKEISSELEGCITPLNIYFMVSQNRHNLLTILQTSFGISSEDKSVLSGENSSCSDSSSDSSVLSGNANDNSLFLELSDLDLIDYTIRIPWTDFVKIAPQEYYYKNNVKKRRYFKLQAGWADIVNDAFWNEHKLPCTFAYKRAKVYEYIERKNYITLEGRCIEDHCKSRLFGFIKEKPSEDEEVILQVKTRNTANVTHFKKRQLTGTKRKEISDKLLSTHASVWQMREAKRIMTYGDRKPSHLYSSTVLRQAKYEKLNYELGIKGEHNPIESLYELMNSTHKTNIHHLSVQKFILMYWSPEQIKLYKDYSKMKNVHTKIMVDATGSLVKRIERPSGVQSGHIFLYEIVISFKNHTVSVCQMLSEMQDASTIEYWINQWRREGIKPPKEVVCDFSLALLIALSKAFCNKSLESYMEGCFKYLRGNSDPPETYIRIDVAHMIKLVTRWKCFTNSPKLVKQFYVRCVALLITARTNEEFENIYKNILIMCNTATDGMSSEGVPTPCETARLDLLKGLKEIKYEDTENYESAKDQAEGDEDEEGNIPASISLWISKISDEMKPSYTIEGDRVNGLYLPNFEKMLRRTAKYYLLWTSILVSPCKSPNITATSSSVEGDFAELKKRILTNTERPLRVDKFYCIHNYHLEGKAVLHSGDFKSDACSEGEYETSANDHILEELNEKENWKNKTKEKTLNKKRSVYLTAAPDLATRLQDTSNAKTPKKRILSNGCMLPPSGKYKYSYTCAFDSIAQCLLSAFINHNDFKSTVENSSNNIFKFISMFYEKGAINQVYMERERVLSRYFKEIHSKSPIGVVTIECWANVVGLIEKAFRDEPCVEYTDVCSTCHITKEWTNPVIRVDLPTIKNEGLRSIEKSIKIENEKNMRPCRTKECEGVVRNQGKVNKSFVFIDTDTYDPFNECNSPTKEDCIANIPEQILLYGKTFRVAGLVNFKGGNLARGHYTAYCKKNNGDWEEFDDMLDKQKKVNKNVIVKSHLLIYVTD